MIYRVLKVWVQCGLWLFAKKIVVTNPYAATSQGPLVLAVNHPNSFLDALLLGIIMKWPVHFIARGDVFEKPWIAKLLHKLHMIPIYRIRDGKEKLSLNEETFTKGKSILEKGQILLIFVEGICIHQTKLLVPLKKGGPRMVHTCWQQNVPVKLLPVWLQYSSFTHIGKTIDVRFGDLFGREIAADLEQAASTYTQINEETERQLLELSKGSLHHLRPGGIWRYILFLPAVAGAILHAPLYIPVTYLAKKLNGKNVHYDGLVLAFLMFAYPLYLFLVAILLYSIFHAALISFASVLLAILLARCYILWKK